MLDWHNMFSLDVSGWELFVRTSFIYLGLIFTVRIFGQREVGGFELPQLLMIVLIADGVQNGMAGDYQSITGALIVAGTLIGWDRVISELTYRSHFMRGLLLPRPLELVRDGHLVRHNMRRELISTEEMHSMLREQGVDHVDDVRRAFLEPDGQLSVIKKTAGGDGRRPRRGLFN